MPNSVRRLVEGMRPDGALGVTALILAVFAGGLVAMSLLGSSSAGPTNPALPTIHPPETEPPATQEAPVAVVTAVAKPTAVRTPATNRESCDEIRWTMYESTSERLWFLQHCQDRAAPSLVLPLFNEASGGEDSGDGAESSPGPASPPASAPSPVPPALVPPPVASFSSADAIVWASGWLAGQAPLGFSVRPDSCVAARTASLQWLVRCSAQAPGCNGADCVVTLAACLIEEPLTIWSC